MSVYNGEEKISSLQGDIHKQFLLATTLYDSLFLAAVDQVRIALLTLNRKRYGLAKAKFSVMML